MPRKKQTELRGLVDGWRGIISDTVGAFRKDDPEGARRLDIVGRKFAKGKNHGLFGSLGRIAFEPHAARTVLSCDLLAAIEAEFDATINFLTYCRERYHKMLRSHDGRAELALTGQIMIDSLAEAGKSDLPWRAIPDLVPVNPPLTQGGVKNARDEIRRRMARNRRRK